MLRSLSFWIKYWLIKAGCRRYRWQGNIRQVIVFSFGRNTLQEQDPLLTTIGRVSTKYGIHRYRGFLQELRFGSRHFVTIDPGRINRQIAKNLVQLMQRSNDQLIVWVQWEVAIALSDDWLTKHWERIRVIWPSPREGALLTAKDVIDFAYFHGEHQSELIPHTAIIAHQSMIIRCMLLWNRVSGALPIVPPQDIGGYLKHSPVGWTRNVWNNFWYEWRSRLVAAQRQHV